MYLALYSGDMALELECLNVRVTKRGALPRSRSGGYRANEPTIILPAFRAHESSSSSPTSFLKGPLSCGRLTYIQNAKLSSVEGHQELEVDRQLHTQSIREKRHTVPLSIHTHP